VRLWEKRAISNGSLDFRTLVGQEVRTSEEIRVWMNPCKNQYTK
jgi:hypothetical protein